MKRSELLNDWLKTENDGQEKMPSTGTNNKKEKKEEHNRTSKKEKKNSRESRRRVDDEEEFVITEEKAEDEEDEVLVYLVGDRHALEEQQSHASLHAFGGSYIEVSIGQDPWTLGPYYKGLLGYQPHKVVNVVTNNSERRGRWCCCSDTTKRAMAYKIPIPSTHRSDYPSIWEPDAVEWRRIGNKKSRGMKGGRKKGRQYVSIRSLLSAH